MNAFLNRLVRPLPWLALVTLLAVNSCSNEHLVSISVTPQNATVTLTGDTIQFQAIGTTNHAAVPPENLTSGVTWSSSTTSVATITATGLATAVSCGTTTITAQDGSLSGQTQLTNTCAGSGGGNPILESINLYPSSPTIPQIGQTNQFIALGVYAPATTNNNLSSVATWASSDTAIATISSTGLATAVSCGTTTITAQYLGVLSQTPLTVSCTVVQTPVLQAINLFPTSPTIQLGQISQFIALGVYSPAGNNNILTNIATWASSNSGVATVGSSTGLATAVSCGTTTITAGYQGVIGQTLLTVPCTGNQTLQSIAVLPSNPTVPQIGQTTQFLALGTLLGGAQEDLTTSATWSSSNMQVATMGSVGAGTAGTATAVNCGTSTISASFTPAGGTPIVGTTLLTVSCNSITSIELLVVKKGSNPGTVTSVPTGISCGQTCGGLFNEGTGFILTAPGGTWTPSSCDQLIGGACYFTLLPDSPGGTSKTVTVTF